MNKFNFLDILYCKKCQKSLKLKNQKLYCDTCKSVFLSEKGVFDFNKGADILVESYQYFQSVDDPYRLKSSPKIVLAGHNRKLQILTRLFERYNLEHKTILDVGSGESIPPFLKQCKAGIIQDISKKALQRSSQKVKDSKFIFVASNQEIPCFSNSIDLIFSGEMLEHVKNPERFIEELFRILKLGGKLILTTPNRKALFYRILGFDYSVCPQHISLQSYSSLIKLLKKRFKIHKIYGFNQSFFHYIDRIITNQLLCRIWAKTFLNKPKYATSLIVECKK